MLIGFDGFEYVCVFTLETWQIYHYAYKPPPFFSGYTMPMLLTGGNIMKTLVGGEKDPGALQEQKKKAVSWRDLEVFNYKWQSKFWLMSGGTSIIWFPHKGETKLLIDWQPLIVQTV